MVVTFGLLQGVHRYFVHNLVQASPVADTAHAQQINGLEISRLQWDKVEVDLGTEMQLHKSQHICRVEGSKYTYNYNLNSHVIKDDMGQKHCDFSIAWFYLAFLCFT